MRPPRCFLPLFLALLATAAAAGDEGAKTQSAWQDYLVTATTARTGYRFPHASCFKAAAAQYKLPETLLLAVARGESDFDPAARSKANAHGVMQIQWPTTAHHLGIYRLSELYDPCTNIDAGARYLAELLDQFGGDLHLALAAYNYGPMRIAADTTRLPEGATWYSGYILRHLNYILGATASGDSAAGSLYSELGRSTLVEFGEPYRAAAFVESMEANAPEVSLDWFRTGVGRFTVVMTYASRDEFATSASHLAAAGFPVP